MIEVLLIIAIASTVCLIVFGIRCVSKWAVQKKINNITEFLVGFPYKIVPMTKDWPGFEWKPGIQLDGCYVTLEFSMGYRDDGKYNYNDCQIEGINHWTLIQFNQGDDIGKTYFQVERVMNKLTEYQLCVHFDDYNGNSWNSLQNKVNVLNTCVEMDNK